MSSLPLRRLVNGIGLFVALTTALSIPVGYALFSYFEETDRLSFQARLSASRLARYIYQHGPMWPFHRVRLAELIELVPDGQEDVWQRIVTAQGKLVLEEGKALASPRLTRSANIIVHSEIVGQLEIQASARPLLINTGLVGLLSFGLGFIAFFGVRVFPLRVLDRTLGQLADREKKLSATNAQFEAALTNMAQGLCMFDAEQRLIVSNDRYAAMFALPPDLVRPGVTLKQIREHRVAVGNAPIGDPDQFVNEVRITVTGGKPHRHTDNLMDGRTMVVQHMPLAGGGWVATLEDATERKRAEAELRSAEEQLRQAQKMEAIGQLTGGLSHDFNNLLGIIIGNLDLLQSRIVDGQDARELLDEAIDASLRGADLNRRLLAFARRQPLQPRNCDLNEVVGSGAKLLTRILGEHVEVYLQAAESLGRVVVDLAQLEAALTNLAVNARDAMPNGGRITVETRDVTLDAEYASAHPGVMPGNYVALAVSDTGSGMPPEVLSRVFEPFFTTKETGKGTGLGLSMVFGFVKQSGGHISIYSEVGAGTTVRIYFPHSEDSSEEPQAASPSTPPRRGNETILAVEDNGSMRRTLVKQLLELGYKVLEADNGHQALAILASEPTVDLLLTDIIMPGGMSGWDLARQAGDIRPDLKLLFTSGFPEASFKPGTEIPADARLLGKPYRTTELAEKVREALAA